MSIKIRSMRGNNWPVHPWQVRVDRASVLGNPFALGRTCSRDQSCDSYKVQFVTWIAHPADNEMVIEELIRLADLHRKYGELELFCWCAPLRCHAETIKEYLEKMI